MYNQVNGGVNAGSGFEDQLWVMRFRGVALESDMPFNIPDFLTWPSQAQCRAAHAFRIQGFSTPYTHTSFDPNCVANLKALLAGGDAIALAIHFDSAWDAMGPGNDVWNPVQPASAVQNNGHVIVAHGYDDVKKAFRVQNSAGIGWGTQGHGWIPYSLFATNYMQAIGAAIRPANVPVPSVV